MPLSSKVNEHLWDALLTEALTESCKNEINSLEIPTEPYEFPVGFEKKIRKIKRSVGRAKRVEHIILFTKNGIITALTIMGLMFGGFLTQPDVYAAVENTVRNIFDNHDSYIYQGEIADNTFNKSKQLVYIPYDYELRSAFYSDNDISLTYESKSGMCMYFQYGLAENSQISIDNERHDYNEIYRNDIIYYFYQANEENSFNSLIWYTDSYYYSLVAQLSAEELVKIAENII